MPTRGGVVADKVSAFVERYAEYKGSWGSGLSPTDIAMLADALSTFLIEQQTYDDDAGRTARSLLVDLSHVCRANPTALLLLERLSEQVDSLSANIVMSQHAVQICYEQSLIGIDRLVQRIR